MKTNNQKSSAYSKGTDRFKQNFHLVALCVFPLQNKRGVERGQKGRQSGSTGPTASSLGHLTYCPYLSL